MKNPPLHAVTYDDLLVGLATRVLLACGVWALLMVLAACLEAGTRGRVRATSWVATPPALRRVLVTALGVLLAGAAPGPVWAALAPPPHRPDPFGRSDRVLPVPSRPWGAVAPRALTVRPGDTLWGLAAAQTRPGAGDAEVLAGVHRWYAHNRRVIGPDPDLIRPGQHLVPPPARPHHREETR